MNYLFIIQLQYLCFFFHIHKIWQIFKKFTNYSLVIIFDFGLYSNSNWCFLIYTRNFIVHHQ